MIRTSELRQGNKLLWGNYIQTVECIGYGNYIQCDPMDADKLIDEFDPIPLTPEILEQCGFVLSNPDTFEGNKYFIKDGFNQLADYGSQGIVLSDKGAHFECGYYENTIDCQFLHQLQNIYFVLTGEELKVNFDIVKQPSHS